MARLRFALLSLALLASGAVVPLTATATPVRVGGCVEVSDSLACINAEGAPTALTGTYSASTDTLSLAWLAPDTTTTRDSYNVYRDDVKIGDTTTLTYDDSLAAVTGVHYYYVAAVTSGVEGFQSDAIWLVKGGSTDPGVHCDPLVLDVYTYSPYFDYGIREECLS